MTDVITCSQPECQLAVSGRCLEGFDPPETCPHQRELHKAADEPVGYVEQDLIALPSGEALTDTQASAVAASGPTKLIVIAGPYGSGKTTILTALFEAFQEAPFGNYTFRGSRTLVGFERRCHLGRKESGQETAETGHTSMREGIVFLHLDLAFRNSLGATNENILLSDISGELFKRVRDTDEAVQRIDSLKRADHLCIVIDGEKVVNKETRQVARNDSRSILRSIVEANVLSKKCEIELVITKWDIIVEVLQSDSGTSLKSFLDGTVEAIREMAPSRRFKVFEVAARPPVKATVWAREDRRPRCSRPPAPRGGPVPPSSARGPARGRAAARGSSPP
jgi:energy-coupling factor transporter ATP-binding protein EcfA2